MRVAASTTRDLRRPFAGRKEGGDAIDASPEGRDSSPRPRRHQGVYTVTQRPGEAQRSPKKRAGRVGRCLGEGRRPPDTRPALHRSADDNTAVDRTREGRSRVAFNPSRIRRTRPTPETWKRSSSPRDPPRPRSSRRRSSVNGRRPAGGLGQGERRALGDGVIDEPSSLKVTRIVTSPPDAWKAP
jgi:hypothetical protein